VTVYLYQMCEVVHTSSLLIAIFLVLHKDKHIISAQI